MDAQSINVIAAAAVGILSPYLAKTGEVAAKELGEDLYNLLKARLGKKPAAQETLSDLEAAPEDPDLQATLRVQLKKLLAEDEEFADQLRGFLEKAGQTETGSIVIKQVAGDNAKQFGQVFGDITIGQD